MPLKKGYEGKVFFFAGLLSGTPTWTEAKSVRDVDNTFEAEEIDSTTRASGGYATTEPGMFNAEFSMEIFWDPADAFCTALKTRFLARESIALKVLDGGTASTGKGLVGDFSILTFPRKEELRGPMLISIRFKPSERGTPPTFQEGS